MNIFQPSLLAVLITSAFFTRAEILKIEITHWNDINGQLESFVEGTSNSSAAPTPCNGIECIGGVINLVNHIFKSPVVHVDYSLRLSSGNLLGGGSGWISSIGWAAYAEFIKNQTKPDALALGLKEFEAGVEQTLQYMDAINGLESKKIVLANTCQEAYKSYPEYTFCNKIAKLKVLTLGSHKIGVIGFVTPTVERLSLPGKLKFWDVATKIGKTIGTIGRGVNTFIALGDGNLEMAKEIIDRNPKVKLVIYGDGLSNTVNMTKEYPQAYKNGFIATAGRYASSIGKLILNWNTETGDLTKDPHSKLIPTTREPWNDEATKAYWHYREFDVAVRIDKDNIFGHSRVPLEGGSKCWRQECNLGNLVTDAMVHCALAKAPLSMPFPYPIHSIWNGGAFVETTIGAGTKVSKFDINKWLPYHNRAHLVKITGSNLRRIFEESAAGIDPEKANKSDWGQFLQVSDGMEVHYEAKSKAPILTRLRMTVDIDGIPRKAELQANKEYYLVVPTYLYEGRGVYDFEKDMWTDVIHKNVTSDFAFDADCVGGYVRAMWQISVGFEERILINGDSGDGTPTDTPSSSTEALLTEASSTDVPLTDRPSTRTDYSSVGRSRGNNIAFIIIWEILFVSLFHSLL